MSSPENHEQRLAKRLQDGNRAAAREFYALYADYLADICARYIVNEEDQKDVFQESFIKIFSNISQFTYRGEGSLKAWAARIVVNESLKYIRSGHQHINAVQRSSSKLQSQHRIAHKSLNTLGTVLCVFANTQRTVPNVLLIKVKFFGEFKGGVR